MELGLSGGEVAVKSKRCSSDGAEEDRISALPDDILLQFLLRLDPAAAGRTSVLSKRWRRVWKLLPELCFRRNTDLHRVRAARSTHDADLHRLYVTTVDAAPESVAACLRVASPASSPSLTGRRGGMAMKTTGSRKASPLSCPASTAPPSSPCIWGLWASHCRPPASSPVSPPSLWQASVSTAHASSATPSPRPLLETLLNLAIHSEPLTQLGLSDVRGLRQLTVVAPSLTGLTFRGWSAHRELVANISAPQLEDLSAVSRLGLER
ncbi:hypothetical protein BS78_05G063000 [Paspalum vaginatum]|nr:hypothetical protein BS78_05G063000 [Paspalum vaginatum]